MAKTRQKKEKDVLDQLLDSIDFRGLTQDEVVEQGRADQTSDREDTPTRPGSRDDGTPWVRKEFRRQ